MPEPTLYVGASWVSAREGGRREIRCPADGTLVGVVDEATAADTEAAIAAARAAFDDGPWPTTTQRERGALLVPGRRPAAARQGRHRPDGEPGHRQAARRERVRRRRRHQRLPALRLDRRRRARAAPWTSAAADVESPRGARAGRGLRAHHARGTTRCSRSRGRSRPACWPATPSSSSPASSPRHTAIHLMQAPGGGGGARRGGQPRPRRRRRPPGAPLSDRSPRRPGLLHRRGRDRQAADGQRRRAPSRRSPSSWAARTPTSSSPTPTARPRSTWRSPRCSCTPARSARPAPGWSSRRASTTSSSTSWSGAPAGIRLGGPFDDRAADRPPHLRRATSTRWRRTSTARSPRARPCAWAVSGSRPASTDLSAGYYFPPTVLDDCHTAMRCVQEESFGPGADRGDLHGTRTRRSGSPTTRSTAWPGGVRTTDHEQGSSGWPDRMRTGTVWINDYHP